MSKKKQTKQKNKREQKIVSQTVDQTTSLTNKIHSKDVLRTQNRSKYSTNMFWKAVNLFALISLLAFFTVAQSVQDYYESYTYFSQVQPYKPGMLDQPISVQGKLRVHDDLEEHEHVMKLFHQSVLFADIDLSHERTERSGQSTKTVSVPDEHYVMDLSSHLYISHEKQNLFLKPKKGDFPLRDFDSPLYLGIQDVTKDYDIEEVKLVFGEEAKRATKMQIFAFLNQRVIIYGKVQQDKDQTHQLISTRKQPLIISNIPHEKLVYEHQKTMVFAVFALLTFFFSKVYVWRGRILHTYLSQKERYWVFNPAAGWEGWGLGFIFVYSAIVIGVITYWDFTFPFRKVQFYLIAYGVLCIALNRLKSMEYFYVADRQTQQLILVDTLWGIKKIIPIMNLNNLLLRTRSFTPRNDITYHQVAGRGILLDTPEVQKQFSGNSFDEDLSELRTSGWCEDILDSFSEWRTPDKPSS